MPLSIQLSGQQSLGNGVTISSPASTVPCAQGMNNMRNTSTQSSWLRRLLDRMQGLQENNKVRSPAMKALKEALGDQGTEVVLYDKTPFGWGRSMDQNKLVIWKSHKGPDCFRFKMPGNGKKDKEVLQGTAAVQALIIREQCHDLKKELGETVSFESSPPQGKIFHKPVFWQNENHIDCLLPGSSPQNFARINDVKAAIIAFQQKELQTLTEKLQSNRIMQTDNTKTENGNHLNRTTAVGYNIDACNIRINNHAIAIAIAEQDRGKMGNQLALLKLYKKPVVAVLGSVVAGRDYFSTSSSFMSTKNLHITTTSTPEKPTELTKPFNVYQLQLKDANDAQATVKVVQLKDVSDAQEKVPAISKKNILALAEILKLHKDIVIQCGEGNRASQLMAVLAMQREALKNHSLEDIISTIEQYGHKGYLVPTASQIAVLVDIAREQGRPIVSISA